MLHHRCLLAGTYPHYSLFDKLAADQVTEYSSHYYPQYPPQSFDTKVHGHKNQQEQIEGYPEQGFTHVREYGIQKWTAPVLVYMGKEPRIKGLYLLPESQQRDARIRYHSNKNKEKRGIP